MNPGNENPYSWNRPDPQIEIHRAEQSAIINILRRGTSAVVLGGRGAGKSVFLHQVRRTLEQYPEVRVVFFAEPPAERSVRACFEDLAQSLDVPLPRVLKAKDLVDEYFGKDAPRNLILIYDELDRYARPYPDAAAGPPGRDFFNSLETMRQQTRNVGILAASSIDYLFRDRLGSSLFSRAEKRRILPFGIGELEKLATPFEEHGSPLPPETLEALYLASGGNPALATYGLETLWSHQEQALQVPTAQDVSEAFSGFQERNSEFLRSFQLLFADPTLSEAPQRVWELIRESNGSVPRSKLEAACDTLNALLNHEDVLNLLAISGLVKIHGSLRADPVVAQPINSILSLPNVPSPAADLHDQLRRDLAKLLHRMHVSSADFFRSGKRGKQLVPEAVFAAFLALGLDLLGWQVDREAQRGAGRTDLVLRRTGSDVAIIETKIWSRNDYQEAHQQVLSYWTAGTIAGAVVQITDADIPEWPHQYQSRCLKPFGITNRESSLPDSPIRACFETESVSADGMTARIDHFLLRLPRRA
jgi:hypothetical protein